MGQKKAIVFCLCILLIVQSANIHSLYASNFVDEKKEVKISFELKDSHNNKAMHGAIITITADNFNATYAITDAAGKAQIDVYKDKTYKLLFSFMGFEDIDQRIYIQNDTLVKLQMKIATEKLNEVVVTAKESNRFSSTSRIGEEAMKLLQPSSFADVLELLPGGVSIDPNMSKANLASLREVSSASEDYAISTLGTGFVVDGVPIQTNMNLQNVLGGWESHITQKNTIGLGVDMRNLSTDGIESIEIIRGVPSVVHGDITNGVIQINRKYRHTGLEGRVKMDVKSKLFYFGNSFSLDDKGGVLHFGVDYLDSKIDPRNALESFKRVNMSTRYRKTWNLSEGFLRLSSYLDYSTSIDNSKVDPDLNKHIEDSFKSRKQKITANATIDAYELKDYLKKVSLQMSVSTNIDKLERVDYVETNGPAVVPTDQIGDYEALMLPYRYIAKQIVKGNPINGFLKLTGEFNHPKWNSIENKLLIGTELRVEKNLGEGYIYDASLPPTPSMSIRPRPFNEVPTYSQLAFFIEEELSIPIGRFSIDARAGVRSLKLLGLDKQYKISKRWYADPRLNVQVNLPEATLFNAPLNISLNYGIGQHTKVPVAAHLYPDPIYRYFTQLNYFHERPENRIVYIRNYKTDPTNYDIDVARNLKQEIRLDINYNSNHLSITYFREKINDGFRSSTDYNIFDYRKYDAIGTVGKPDISLLPYEEKKSISTHGKTTNGSALHKQGIEYQLSLSRFKFLNTRLTINGAWFVSEYFNSQALLKKASQILNGKELEYLGLYDDRDGFKKQAIRTNFTLDSYIPKIGLNFSITAQCLWSAYSKRLFNSGVPTHYIDIENITHEFTEESAKDKELQWLINSYNEQIFEKVKDPISIYLNLKVRKRVYKNCDVSLFVNRFFTYLPDYEIQEIVQRRHSSPYFGLELSIKL